MMTDASRYRSRTPDGAWVPAEVPAPAQHFWPAAEKTPHMPHQRPADSGTLHRSLLPAGWKPPAPWHEAPPEPFVQDQAPLPALSPATPDGGLSQYPVTRYEQVQDPRINTGAATAASRPGDPDGDSAAAMLQDPLLVNLLGMRLVRASAGHALYTQSHLGNPAAEPGPHALMLLSGRPSRGGTAQVVGSGRLFHVGEADDLPAMLHDLARIVDTMVADARRERRLLAYLTVEERARLGRRLLPGRRAQAPHSPFPYAAALEQGLLWDPRTPGLGIVSTSDAPPTEPGTAMTADTTYLGVAVTTLDTETTPWASVKKHYAKAKDPVSGMPLTPAHLPGLSWALLENGTGLHVRRMPAVSIADPTYEITASTAIAAALDSRGITRYDPAMTRKPPAMFGTRDLWEHLSGLHTALREAFGYRSPT
ncbi:MAG: hypothetical protein QOE61_941 [Micromonosporaceae bacterium]|nr:hypothetical protein [Micromonosporaceae bacterium]